MSARNMPRLLFYLKSDRQNPYAARLWPAVPRLYDAVMLKDPDRDPNPGVKFPARVIDVVWGMENLAEEMAGILKVGIVIEWIET